MVKKEFMDGYKTYDTSDGFGNSNEWRKTFSKRMGSKEARKILEEENKTPEQILEIDNKDWMFYTFGALRRKYKEMIMKYHPDRGGATNMAQRIIAAYTILKGRMGE